MKPPVGYGLPPWVNTERYLSADETRALGNVRVHSEEFSEQWKVGNCLVCGKWRSLQWAHIVRVGNSGRRKHGTDGPQAGICYECHTAHDHHQEHYAMLVRREDHALCIVRVDGTERVLLEHAFEKKEGQ